MILKHKELTSEILNSFYEVYNTLGYGFLEKVYENALLDELKRRGLKADAQRAIDVYYKGKSVGRYYADIIVDNKVILEIKVVECLSEKHGYQLINYLRSTDIEVGLLLNFGKSPSFVRKVFTNLKPNNKTNSS